jgi:hypothetical protein
MYVKMKHSNISGIQNQICSSFIIVMNKLLESVSYNCVTGKSNNYVYEEIYTRLIISVTPVEMN